MRANVIHFSTYQLPGTPGGATRQRLTQTCGLKSEGNRYFLESLYMGVFLEGLHLYGCVSTELTPIWVCY